MKNKIIFIILLMSINVFSISFNTTSTCFNATTLFEETNYSNGNYFNKYIPCQNGCVDGYCISTSETNNYLNLTTILLLIVSAILIIVGLDFIRYSSLMGLSIFGLGILLILLNLFLVGVYGQSFTNPIMNYVGNIGFTISSLFIFGLVFIAIAIVGLSIIKRREGGLVGWDE